ncbi:hypothetical protein AUM95_21785, partial [Cronobacter sakazakii]|uniref:RHS repeat domain-containing protein n=1 Tax=Cronobacter sakazakii TaxID=28141 RepID=UPI000D520D0D
MTRNARGQVVSAADPAGHLTRLRYDRFGRLTTLVNPNRESWRFEYDAAGRPRAYTHLTLSAVSRVVVSVCEAAVTIIKAVKMPQNEPYD